MLALPAPARIGGMEQNPYESPLAVGIRRPWTYRSARYLIFGMGMMAYGATVEWVVWMGLAAVDFKWTWGDFCGAMFGMAFILGGLRVVLVSLRV